MKTFQVIVPVKHEWAVEQPSHVRQCRVAALAPSRIAFARMLLDYDIWFVSEAAASRYVAEYGGETWESGTESFEAGVLYVKPMNRPMDYKAIDKAGAVS